MVVGRRRARRAVSAVRNVIIAAAATVVLGCEKAPPVTPPGQTNAAPAPAVQTAAQAQPAAAPGEARPDSEWCPAAYSDTAKIVEAMKATMKHAGRDAGEDAYQAPEEARYLELCAKLPLEMQKCLVIGYAARNRDACEGVLAGLDEAQRAAYAELMGK